MSEITLEVWGDFACFTPPWGKVERMTYPFPTPSAARGILSSIYSKPAEFYWQVNRIEVLRPIRYVSFKRNEITGKTALKTEYSDNDFFFVDDYLTKTEKGKEITKLKNRTQRQTVALRDVRYRISASVVPRPEFSGTLRQLEEQALRRISRGACFLQPSLGMREFVCYFSESDGLAQPIREDLDAGLIVYDVFDLHDYALRKKTQPKLSLFHAVMERGVILVPPYDSPEVLKGGAGC